jgi:DNA-binding PucR family transcriptional regulator
MREKLQELITEMFVKEIPFDLAKREFEAIYLREIIARNGGNFSATAKQLGIHRNTLSRKIGHHSDFMRYHYLSRPDASADKAV